MATAAGADDAPEISPELVRKLRDKTNAGIMDCKRALAECGGDLEKAEAALRTKGIAGASKKASRATKEGIVASYIHLQGKVGVLVEVNCETDFVAKNEKFREFVKDITLHIAAAHPLYVNREEVPAKLCCQRKKTPSRRLSAQPVAAVYDRRLFGVSSHFGGHRPPLQAEKYARNGFALRFSFGAVSIRNRVGC